MGNKEEIGIEEGLEFKPISLKVKVNLFREKNVVESCCNYEISGKGGNMLLVLPPMTHIQDMKR